MRPRSKRQRMVPTVTAQRLKQMAPKSKKRKKARAKKTLTKRQKEKRVRKRKMVREKKKKRGMTNLYFSHPTSSFRTTYTKYATSSSSLLSKTKKRSTATVRKKNALNKKKRAKCQTNPILNMTEHL